MATQSSSEPTDDQTTEPARTPAETSSETHTDTPAETSAIAQAEASVETPIEPIAEAPAGTTSTTGSVDPVAPAQPTVVFVQAPVPPKKRGARGVGALVALLGTALFSAAYALLVLLIAIIGSPAGLAPALQYLSSVTFYLPVIIFFLSYLLLVIIVNRGGWWAHVLGGFVVAIVVWIGFVGAALISASAIGAPSAEVGSIVLQQLTNPLGFAAAIAAREVPIWVGGLVSRRGRTARARNAEALTAYEQELAEHRATLSANTAV